MDLKLPEKRVFIGPANIWKRILALLIDLLVLDFFVIGFFRDILIGIVGDGEAFSRYTLLEGNEAVMGSLSMVFMLIVTLVITYFVLLQYAIGQTIGCLVLNIYVVHPESEKELVRPKFWQCIVRNLFVIPTLPFILLWVIDPVYMLFAKKGQRLTEMLSRTRVVERFEI
jgi:hypothetical protein